MQGFNKINIDNTLNSGQVFLWRKYGELWYGVNGQDIFKINRSGRVQSYHNNMVDFFRKKDKMNNILESISKDDTIKLAIKRYLGLRLIRQDPFQCMISFIASSNSNIQKIKSNLENLSKKFGKKIEWDKKEFYLFPEPKAIANSDIAEISSCGLGYRARFVYEASRLIEDKELDFGFMKKSSYQEAKELILKVPGVGNKVADCILLFSLDKLDAFPLDRWMIRILQKYYSDTFKIETKTITDKQYQLLHEKIVDYFGQYAGYAQQFLFKMERENYHKKWL